LQVDAPARLQDAEPDTQERGQQHEIGEVAQVADVGRYPADAGQLHEQDRERAQEQVEAVPKGIGHIVSP